MMLEYPGSFIFLTYAACQLMKTRHIKKKKDSVTIERSLQDVHKFVILNMVLKTLVLSQNNVQVKYNTYIYIYIIK